MADEKDYVLGTHDDEIARLGLQHRVWRPRASDAWRRAGFTTGQTLLDVGCGPGYATVDLAGISGPQGRVIGVDRSRRFLDAAMARARAHGVGHAEFHELDLDEHPLPAVAVDGAWSRWVYAFVQHPQALLAKVAAVLRPGGVMVLHEYCDYRAWRLSPAAPEFSAFVDEVMASWREHGGEPDIGLELPRWLVQAGLKVREMRPLVEVARPDDFVWQWPNAFVEVGLQRLVDLGRMTPSRAAEVRRAFQESQATPGAFLITPTVIEIIAVKR
jgi:ubiquinone/menaquinone biosynthesis C-methylase UbiE